MGTRSTIAGWVLALCVAANASAQHAQIQFAEKVSLAAVPGHAQFDAYGRRFSLELESNDSALAKLPAQRKAEIAGLRLLRGRLEGQPGSWVRLTAFDGRIEGAIWDGEDLYAVTSYDQIAAALTTPLVAAADQTVVYRLADTRGSLPENFCGLDASAAPQEAMPAAQYKALVGELRAQAAAAAVVGDQIELALIADGDYDIRTGGGVIQSMMYRYNIVEGIFAEQVGVLIRAADIRVTTGPADPFTSNNPQTLLSQLSSYRNSTPAVRARGLAHLITGKDLSGGIAGIANIDALCSATQGVSLSQGTAGGAFGGFSTALIMAHEIGHNFGARHDSETTCTANSFLMSASYSGSSQFSSCSLASMAQSIARARGTCISPALYADIEVVPFEMNIQVETEIARVVPVTLRNSGTQAANAATILIDGGGLIIESVNAPLGSCTVAGPTASCSYASIPIGATRELTISVRAATVRADYILSVTADATNDVFELNNEWRSAVQARSSIDAALTMLVVSTSPLFIGDTLHVVADVSPARSRGLTGSVVTLSMEGAAPGTMTTTSGSCVKSDTYRVTCTLADVPPGQSAHIDVTALAAMPGTHRFIGNVQTPTDDNNDNNTKIVENVYLQAVRDATLAVPASFHALIGATEEVQFTVSAPGRETVNDLILTLVEPFGFNLISLRIDGVDCPPPVMTRPRCTLASVAPGETHVVTVRFSSPYAIDYALSLDMGSPNDQYQPNNSAAVQIRTRYRVDAQVENSTVPTTATDGIEAQGSFYIYERGFDAAINVVVTVEVPAEVRLLSARVGSGSNAWQCSLQTAQRARCTIAAYGPEVYDYVLYKFVGDVPGTYAAHVTISADSDANAANNAADYPLQILGFEDVRLTGLSGHESFSVGVSREFQLTLSTDRRTVTGVTVRAVQRLPYLELVSMSSAGYACTINATQGECIFGDVPANASIPITVTYRGVQDVHGSNIFEISASSTRDANSANNHTHAEYDVGQPTDLAISTASPGANAVVGGTLIFPRITVTNGVATAFQPVVDISLPDFLSVATISAGGAICSGTRLLRCNFASLAPGASITIDLSLNALTVGSVSTSVRVTSSSDNNNGNDAIAVNLNVTATAPPAPPPVSTNPPASGGSSRGGGGGGRLEWLALGFLLLMGARRLRAATI